MPVASIDWTEISAIASGAAAIGTLALAAVTWRLAAKTKDMADTAAESVELTQKELAAIIDQANATRQQVELSRSALEATRLPMLVPLGEGQGLGSRTLIALDGRSVDSMVGPTGSCWQSADGSTWAVVPMRNAGSGPALIPIELESVVGQFALFGGFTAFGRPSQRVVAPNDVVYLVWGMQRNDVSEFTLALKPEESGSSGIVVIAYTGIDGINSHRTRLCLRYSRNTGFLDTVTSIENLKGGDEGAISSWS